MIDLNEMPDDANSELHSMGGIGVEDPMYCTQPIATPPDEQYNEVVAESPNPMSTQHAPAAPEEAVQTEGDTFDDTTTLGETGGTIGQEGVGNDNDDEAWSQPKKPFVGMRFDTLEGAKEHYNAYALRLGFSIKMNTSRKFAYTGQLEKQQFVCNKFRKPKVDDRGAEITPALDVLEDINGDAEDGVVDEIVFIDDECKKKKKSKKRKRDTIVQTGCRARMVVKLKDGRWEVIFFVGEHNHALVDKPSLTKYLRSHQGIPPEERLFLTNLHNCNLTTGRMMNIMSEFYGTELIVSYTTKAISNLKSALNKMVTGEGDMIETVAYFKDQQKSDPNFFYKVKYDEEDRVVNIFWVDGEARRAYAEAYHDCASFDTTYMTNMYNMPFAPFIGINRHGQSFMLGCGFVRQELETSFDWLFGAFLEAMHGRAPNNIITDQDIAMAESIKNIFPTSVHRRCRWNIMKKAQEKLGAMLGRNPGLSKDFNKCVDFSFTPEEFEANWAALMMKYQAAIGTHFDKLYEYRETWVPCYFKHRFFPSLQSTQRSEGFNAVLKRYVNPHGSILNFVKQYEKIQIHVLVQEGAQDYRTEHLETDMWSPFPIEKQAYEAYTRDLYKKFHDEFEMIGRYNVCPRGAHLYELEPNHDWVAKYGSRHYFVSVESDAGNYTCKCCKMDRDGILCCHILKVFTHIGVDEIPAQYIVRRWTPLSVPGAPLAVEAPQDEMPPLSKRQVRHTNLQMDFASLAKVASAFDAAANILKKHMRAARTELAHQKLSKKKKPPVPTRARRIDPQTTTGAPPPPPLFGAHAQPPSGYAQATSQPSGGAGHSGVPGTPHPDTPGGSGPAPTIPRDPPKSTTKGRAKSKRMESALELHPKRKNKCSFCGFVDHNAANCEARLV